MATGTGAIAFDLLSRTDAVITGADITRPMLLQTKARSAGRFDGRLRLVECSAEAPPFANESFDAITFADLLRYVSAVRATLGGLARLVRPGGSVASPDFARPNRVSNSCPYASRQWAHEGRRNVFARSRTMHGRRFTPSSAVAGETTSRYYTRRTPLAP